MIAGLNNDYMQGRYYDALIGYFSLSASSQVYERVLSANIDLVLKKQFSSIDVAQNQSVKEVSLKKKNGTALIITWDVGHNCLGRSYIIAEVFKKIYSNVVLMGFQFPRYGKDIWEPLRKMDVNVISVPGQNFPNFLEDVEKVARGIEPSVVVSCKARLPSLLLGLRLKQLYKCPIIADIDDHELSFFNEEPPITLNELRLIDKSKIKNNIEPYGEMWTRFSHNLVDGFDGVITSNVALQREFGGIIIPHVRDENSFDRKKYDRLKVRAEYGIPADSKVLLFFGTPRQHKGIDVLGKFIGSCNNDKCLLVVVGTTPDKRTFDNLKKISRDKVVMIDNQPFSSIPKILSMADLVCLPQDESHPISKYQLPAKAIDAIGMGVPLVVTRTEPLMPLVEDKVAIPVSQFNLESTLQKLLSCDSFLTNWSDYTRRKFVQSYSYTSAAVNISEYLKKIESTKINIDRGVGESIEFINNTFQETILDEVKAKRSYGKDIVIFWKQNDTGLYGRRHEMVAKYLASRDDVRTVTVFDLPLSEHNLSLIANAQSESSHEKDIFQATYRKVFELLDEGKLRFRVYIHPAGTYDSGWGKPQAGRIPLVEGFSEYLNKCFVNLEIDPKKAVFWFYPKFSMARDLVNIFKPASVVVDVVDDHRSWPDVTVEEKVRISAHYSEILSMANFSFVNCEPMKESMSEFVDDIVVVPNGCEINPRSLEPSDSKEYNYIKTSNKRIIGFVGNLEKKIDITLLEKIAIKFSGDLLVLVGSTHANPDINKLKKYSNIIFAGVQPYHLVGAWVSKFNVGLIPHLNFDMTRYMNPLKLYVYLTWGIPVVSTDVENVDGSLDCVRVSSNHNDFVNSVEFFLNSNYSACNSLKSFLLDNSWEARFKSHVDKIISFNR